MLAPGTSMVPPLAPIIIWRLMLMKVLPTPVLVLRSVPALSVMSPAPTPVPPMAPEEGISSTPPPVTETGPVTLLPVLVSNSVPPMTL